MPTDYEAIAEENRRRYGTEIARIGPMLLADRYNDRTHFIFELLQNAEDALSRRTDATGPRRVSFALTRDRLTISHFGKPFDERDVRGICGIDESTKDELSIGRFGIGFKSVYTFTDRPEIHSGDEHFAVENYVQPRGVTPISREAGETQIILPLRPSDTTAASEIEVGLRQLGMNALLFLRHIDEITWSVEGGASGVYLRGAPKLLGVNVRRVGLLGQDGEEEVDQEWLVFNRDVISLKGGRVGNVELAFSLAPAEEDPGRWAVQPIATSPLVVFFPTIVATNLAFLVQGPYRTTPSRDNVRTGEPWNQQLVQETASLLVESIRWMRDNATLDTQALRCLPIDRTRFPSEGMFAPVFDSTKQAFKDEALLPRFDTGYVAARDARLVRSQELRELFDAAQLEQVFKTTGCAWLAGDITHDKAPELRRYLMQELDVPEVSPDQIILRLDQEFLERQSDAWTARLYSYLNDQKALLPRLGSVPLIRLEDGTHVVARQGGETRAFLPSTIETGFPTVRRAVCNTAEARTFLTSLGLTEPDPVDDVIRNVLPQYQQESVNVDESTYARDFDRICAAFATDSNVQREKLLGALRRTSFVMVVDAADGKEYVAQPGNVYIATERLKGLYAGIAGVLIVNDNYACLRGETARDLLEACGAMRCPRPMPAPHALTYDERLELRSQTGHPETSGRNDDIQDWDLLELDALLQLLPSQPSDARQERARLLWESLSDLEERRGRGVFDGAYSWTHFGVRRTPPFPAAFVRRLNKAAWVTNAAGNLVHPNQVTFESLGWKPNPFLLSKFAFKPPIIEQLAKAAGIDPAALDLLRSSGITSVTELASRLGISAEREDDTPSHADVGAQNMPSRDGEDSSFSSPNNGSQEHASGSDDGGRVLPASQPGHAELDRERSGAPTGLSDEVGVQATAAQRGTGMQESKTPKHTDLRFISYVAAHPDDDGPDPDGLDHAARMRLEEKAIALIISLEPSLCRTPAGNHGFDLYAADENGVAFQWVEVKSMSASLDQRPVGLSRRQFEEARVRGDAYWVYIVEHAGDPARARVLKIQNPFALAKTFTFDRGWRDVAIEVTQAGRTVNTDVAPTESED